MKRVWSLLVICVLLMQLCGCGVYDIMTADSNAIDEMSEEIIRCLIEKDREALEAFFCQRVRSTEEFETQMDELYSFFDYDYFSRYDLNGDHAQSQTRETGKRVAWSVSAEISYIEVGNEDGTRFYRIEYDWTETYLQDTALVGLHSISIQLLNTDQVVTAGTDEYFPF